LDLRPAARLEQQAAGYTNQRIVEAGVIDEFPLWIRGLRHYDARQDQY
jgi:hypothetical protein